MESAKNFRLIVIVVLFTFSSCGAIIKSYIRKDTENVPVGFGKEKTTLVVVVDRRSYGNKIDKIFKENYSGEYVFVTTEELNRKYGDTAKYQYVLHDDISISSSKVTTITTDRSTGISTRSTETRSAASRSFHIWDRKTRKIHDTGVSSGTSWKTILKAYLQKLDTERKKNQDR